MGWRNTSKTNSTTNEGDEMNNWQLIREFYDMMNPAILKEKSNEWAIDPYAWDTGLVTMTPIESWFWQDIRQANAVFYPQYPVEGFFLDFANPVAKVGIECDGHDYHLDKEKDRERDQKLQALGWTIYRITGAECRIEFDDETREYSPGQKLMKRICDNHKVSRFEQ
jgi:very-short-patch-repair endonuclease